MSNNNEIADEQGVKHTVFDSVFKDLFADLNNVRAVYLKLHPQDVDVTVDDIQIKTLKAVKEAIRICKDKDVLRQYLTEKEAEIVSVMQMLFDQDYIWDVHVRSEVKQAREEEREKAAKEKKEVRDKGILIAITSLRKHKISDTDILQDLMDNYNLDRSAAEKYMAMPASESTNE